MNHLFVIYKINQRLATGYFSVSRFRCDVLINKELICMEYASNKQDAKKKAGATAIQKLLHKDSIAVSSNLFSLLSASVISFQRN